MRACTVPPGSGGGRHRQQSRPLDDAEEVRVADGVYERAQTGGHPAYDPGYHGEKREDASSQTRAPPLKGKSQVFTKFDILERLPVLLNLFRHFSKFHSRTSVIFI